jgi:hypothetical protein
MVARETTRMRDSHLLLPSMHQVSGEWPCFLRVSDDLFGPRPKTRAGSQTPNISSRRSTTVPS